MAVVEKSALLQALTAAIGDRTDDDAIALLENATDTLNDYDTRTRSSTDWEKKYNENDAAWRQRYIARFNGTAADEDFINGENNTVEKMTSDITTADEPEVDKTWEDLYE